ncbi:hypothetical protein FACS1894132_08080 [Clostridia bacterium]|nr:hypothetical protein FACS1894132_08080 [Clostridia bacterium]
MQTAKMRSAPLFCLFGALRWEFSVICETFVKSLDFKYNMFYNINIDLRKQKENI